MTEQRFGCKRCQAAYDADDIVGLNNEAVRHLKNACVGLGIMIVILLVLLVLR